MIGNELENARRAAAEEELENYDFDDCELVDSSGWEFDSASDVLEKPIFVKSADQGPDEDTRLGSFVVEFAPGSDIVLAAEAKLDGEKIGYHWSDAPAPGR